VVKKLVQMMEDASSMVDFFNKEDEIRNVRREIRRTIMLTSFDDENLRKIIMEEFMELAKVKFQ
jgi:type I restriction enzyme R subunit